MSVAQRIGRNTASIIVGRALNIFLSAFVAIYLARYLGSGGLGIYSLVYAYLSFFSFLTIFGLGDVIVREISKDNARTEELIGSALTLSIFFSILAICLSWMISHLLGYPSAVRMLIYIASLNMLFAPWGLYTSVFQVHLQQKYQMITELASKLILAGLVLLLISVKASLVYFILLNLFEAGLIAIGNRILSHRFVRPKWRIDLKVYRYLLRQSWPLAFSSLLIAISIRIDQVMLYQMKGETFVGFYSAAVKPVELFNIVPLALSLSIFPLLSKYFAASKESFNRVYHLSLKYMAIFVVPVAVSFTIFSKDIICMLYGKEFLPSARALAILVWSTISIYPGLMYHQAIIASGNQKFTFIATAINAFCNVSLNLMLIPRYGFVGAGLATAISEISIRFIMCLFPAIREYAIAPIVCLFKPLIGSSIMGFSIYLFSLSFGRSLIVTPFIYLGIMLLIKGIDRGDFEVFRGLIIRRDVAINV